MSEFELFPGFKSAPTAQAADENGASNQKLARLRAKYIERPRVKAEVGYGSIRNWSVFKLYVEWLEAEIKLWKDGHRRHDTLTALAWHVAGEVYKSHGLALLDFNEHRQRCYLKNGLIELCILICEELEAKRG